MKRVTTAWALLILALCHAPSLLAQAPEPLVKIADDWQTAFNAGDMSTIVALYTDDAVRSPPDEPLIRGSDAILADLQANAGLQVAILAMDGLLGEDFGTTWGRYELSGTVEGEMVSQEGRWMNVVKKTPDGWKIYRDIWQTAEMPTDEDGM